MHQTAVKQESKYAVPRANPPFDTRSRTGISLTSHRDYPYRFPWVPESLPNCPKVSTTVLRTSCRGVTVHGRPCSGSGGTHEMPQLILFTIDICAVALLVFGLYFPRHRRRDLVVAYLGVNVGVLAVASALSASDVGA